MPVGTEVGLDPRNIVLDGDPALPPKGAQPPNFRPISVVAKWLDGLRCHLVWRFVLDGDPALPSPKGGGAHNFPPVSIVAKRLYGPRWQLVRR